MPLRPRLLFQAGNLLLQLFTLGGLGQLLIQSATRLLVNPGYLRDNVLPGLIQVQPGERERPRTGFRPFRHIQPALPQGQALPAFIF